MTVTRSKKQQSPWWRARTLEHKEARRDAIMASAWDLFQECDYAAVTVAQVAARAGLAKGTVYLYFETKEELFFAVAFSRLDEWLDALDRGLAAGAGGNASMTALFARTLRSRQDLLRILGMLPTLFEATTDPAMIGRFKAVIVQRLARTGLLLEKSLRFLRPGEGARLLLRIQALIIGLWKLSGPGPVNAQVRRDPGLRAMRVDFFADFTETVSTLLAGLEVRGGAGARPRARSRRAG